MKSYVKPLAAMVQLMPERAFASGCTVTGSCTGGQGIAQACIDENVAKYGEIGRPNFGVS